MHQRIVKEWMQEGRKERKNVKEKNLYFKTEPSKNEGNDRNQKEIND
jgi:hypothetical protein